MKLINNNKQSKTQTKIGNHYFHFPPNITPNREPQNITRRERGKHGREKKKKKKTVKPVADPPVFYFGALASQIIRRKKKKKKGKRKDTLSTQ